MFFLNLGECLGRYSNKKIPYCVKFNPDEVCKHIFKIPTMSEAADFIRGQGVELSLG